MVRWSEASVMTSILTKSYQTILDLLVLEKHAQMVPIEITKSYYSAIAIVEAKCPGRDERVAREALWWKRP